MHIDQGFMRFLPKRSSQNALAVLTDIRPRLGRRKTETLNFFFDFIARQRPAAYGRQRSLSLITNRFADGVMPVQRAGMPRKTTGGCRTIDLMAINPSH